MKLREIIDLHFSLFSEESKNYDGWIVQNSDGALYLCPPDGDINSWGMLATGEWNIPGMQMIGYSGNTAEDHEYAAIRVSPTPPVIGGGNVAKESNSDRFLTRVCAECGQDVALTVARIYGEEMKK